MATMMLPLLDSSSWLGWGIQRSRYSERRRILVLREFPRGNARIRVIEGSVRGWVEWMCRLLF